MIRRLFRDWLNGLRAGFDVLWWGHAYPLTFPLQRRGGTTPPPLPLRPGERRALLSPGRFDLPPGTEGRYPSEFIERINRGRRP